MAAKKKKSWRRTVTERVLDALIDASGEFHSDWYDQKAEYEAMIEALAPSDPDRGGWIAFPAPWEDQVLDVGAEIENLLSISLNPYQLIERTLSADGVAEECVSQSIFARDLQAGADFESALELRADAIEVGGRDIDFSNHGNFGLAEVSRRAIAACLRKEAKQWRRAHGV